MLLARNLDMEMPLDTLDTVGVNEMLVTVTVDESFTTKQAVVGRLDKILDGKTGLLTGLLTGKQGISSPVSLLVTCCGSKSLKVILIDSDFGDYPLLNPLVTL